MSEQATEQDIKGVIAQIPEGYHHKVQELSKKKVIWVGDHGKENQPDKETFKALSGVESVGTIRVSLGSHLLLAPAS